MKKVKKLSIKTLAFFLSIVLAVVSLPLSAIAMAFENGQEELESNVTILDEPVELIDERTADTKRFRMENGSFVVAQYDTAVHYLDENGRWQDIDNRLTADGSEISTSNAKIKFAKKTTGNGNLFALHDGNRKITLSLNGANKKVEGQIKNFATELGEDATKLEKMTTLDRISASVRYEDILENTDLEYVVHGLNIKENIIVKEKGDSYSYSFTMSLNQLYAQKTPTGEIEILDSTTGEVAYRIPAPIVWDANGESASAAEYTLIDLGNGKFNLIVTADSSWMNDSNRAYPITIDPPLYSSLNPNVTDLSFSVNSGARGASDDRLYVSDTYRTYWKLSSLANLPASAYITNAEISLTAETTANSYSGRIGVFEVLQSWSSSLSQDVSYNSSFIDYQSVDVNGAHTAQTQYFWNITPLVKKWYQNSTQNFGVRFASVGNASFLNDAVFYSDDYTSAGERPCLIISYYDMKGLEDYWSFSSQSAGFAGTGAVNHATGNLVFTIPTVSSLDSLLPITPTFVYNSALAGDEYVYPNAQTPFSSPYTPKGMRLNIQETLIKQIYVSYGDITQYRFVWADSDCTEHYFFPTNEPNTYRDEDGLHLTLVENGDADVKNCTITDDAGTVRTFHLYGTNYSSSSSNWYLASITDPSNNRVEFAVDSAYRPVSVVLTPNGGTAITQLQIAYDAQYMPCVIWNPTSGEGVVMRYDAEPDSASATPPSLIQTVRAHGATDQASWLAFYNTQQNVDSNGITVDAVADYSYDVAGRLTSVVNGLSQYRLAYSYQGERVIAVEEFAGANSTRGQKLTMEYGTTSTVLRTSGSDDVHGNADDLLTTYVFDAEGRTISSYTTNLTKTQIYGASSGQYVADNANAKNSLKTASQTTQHSSNYLLNGGFEQSSPGERVGWGGQGLVDACQTEFVYEGKQAACLSISSGVGSSKIYQEVFLDKGDYSVSMQIRSFYMQNVRVFLKVESENAQHTVEKEISADKFDAVEDFSYVGLNFSADPAVQGGKERFVVSVLVTGTLEDDEEYPLVDVQVDNIMLSKTTGAAEYDMLTFGHFEASNNQNLDAYWSANDDGSPVTVDSGNPSFGDVLKITSSVESDRSVFQRIDLSNAAEKEAYRQGTYVPTVNFYTFSGWAMGTQQCFTGDFWVDVFIYYYRGNEPTICTVERVTLDKWSTDWQFFSGCIVTDPTQGVPDYVEVRLCYRYNPGVAYFDEISFVQNSVGSTVFDYTQTGMLRSYQNGTVGATYQYNEDDKVSRVKYSDLTGVSYTYDECNRVIQEDQLSIVEAGDTDDPAQIGTHTLTRTLYEYNSYGLLVTTTTYEGLGTAKKIVTSATYHTSLTGDERHLFGAVKTETDEYGGVTRYFYDFEKGRLVAATYPDETGVCFTYDELGNLIQVLPAKLRVTGSSFFTQYGYESVANSAEVQYAYNPNTNRLDSITTESTVYSFTYDAFGNSAAVQAGDSTLASYEYNQNNGKLSVLTYGNGLKVQYLYDALDRVEEICYNTGEGESFETVYSYTYNSAGQLFTETDHKSGQTTVYTYDFNGRLDEAYVYDEATYKNLLHLNVDYDGNSRLQAYSYGLDYGCVPNGSVNLYQYVERYAFGYGYEYTTGFLARYLLESQTLNGVVTPTYDAFGRTQSRELLFDELSMEAYYGKYQYTYKTTGGNQTGQVSSLTVQSGGSSSYITSSTTYGYTYDEMGNITQITKGGVVQQRYEYDDLGQLVREDDRASGNTYVYSYDNAGNLLAKKRYDFTTGTLGTLRFTYSYGYDDSSWGDLLTSYHLESIEYDAIGNPIRIGIYNAEEDFWQSGYELTWEGRRLISYRRFERYTAEDSTYYESPIEYSYNADGIRVSKTVNGVEHKYYLNGSQILAEVWNIGSVEFSLHYLYDENGMPMAIRFRTSEYEVGAFDTYFLEHNLQGDIVALYCEGGSYIGGYTYDAWGNATVVYADGISTTDTAMLRIYNPFRYRGYYYDTETGLYYLQSRYYNPEWGRFINADSYVNANGGLIGFNVFAYCDNNPITRKDDGGTAWETVFDVVSLCASVVEVCVNPTDPWAWAGLIGDTVDLIPFLTGVGETTRAVKLSVKVVNKVDDVVDIADDVCDTVKIVVNTQDTIQDTVKIVTKKHGNSLFANKLNFGYQILDSNNNVIKYGETLYPGKRYSKKWLKDNGYSMQVLVVGTKRGVHNWQHEMISNYVSIVGKLPDLNNNLW